MKQFDELKIENDLRSNDTTTSSAFRNSFERMTKDMTFVGTFLFVYGIINCFTIVGAIFGVPMIFAGLHMRGAADHFSYFRVTNNSASLKSGLDYQAKYFRIFRILIIIGICTVIVMIILVAVFAAVLVNKFSPQ